jgi:putative protease
MPLTLAFSAKSSQPLTVSVSLPEKSFVIQSTMNMRKADKSVIDQSVLEKRFKSFNNTDYDLKTMDFSSLEADLSIPFSELTKMKNAIALKLNGSNELIAPIIVPPLINHAKADAQTTLSIMISDEKDLHLCDVTTGDVYFKLPESFKKGDKTYIKLLLNNPRLIPWFPAVLIGKDYIEAVKILEQVKPASIVSNNTGIAYKAFELAISWIAGPFLNTTNSYALLTLKEDLNCAGAFISNEINQTQIRKIARPDNFTLLYSIYHPILMMTSRQCFFQQTVGCNKPTIEDGCMLKCTKATTITNVKGIKFAVDKQKGGYPSIYNDEQFLNLDVVNDLADKFDGFFIDLTNIGAGSKAEQDKTQLIRHFEGVLADNETSQSQLKAIVPIYTNAQYVQGL